VGNWAPAFETTAPERLVLALASPECDESAVAEAATACDDWPAFHDLISRHNLLPTWTRRVAADALAERLPEEERQRAAEMAPRFYLLDRIQVIALQEVLEVLTSAGIPSMLLKGHALAERLYADPLERLSVDIDLLVHRESMQPVHEALQSRGYDPVNPEFYAKTHFHTPYLRRDNGLPFVIEVHWELSPGTSPVQFHPEAWWPMARPSRLRAGETLLPPPARMVVHHAWHAFNKGAVTLRDLGELRRLWRRITAESETEAALVYARETNALGFLTEALELNQAFWGPIDGVPATTGRGPRWLGRKLLDPRAVLREGGDRWPAYRKIAYWSLLAPGDASLGFLVRDVLRDVSNHAMAQHREPTWGERLSALSELGLALGLCALPLPRPGRSASSRGQVPPAAAR
jgi:hypothetical protein